MNPSYRQLRADASGMQRFGGVFDYAGKQRTLAELDERSRADDFWTDAARAQVTMKQIADLRAELAELDAVGKQLDDAAETIEILGDEAGAADEVDRLIEQAFAGLDALEMAANFDQPYDSHGAIVTIHAGAGGVDAADWTEILSRMYLRWAEKRGYKAHVTEESLAEEAGLKSITFFIRGKNAYGMLESERGVHRLVRISPFDAAARRHTSFASIDIVPEIEGDDVTSEIRPEDLRIETFKAGGAGGQYVNKTESAIRIIHVPTNTIVASQQERSQLQNREVAMTILRAKLAQREREEREAKLMELRGERRANEWGSQIRSYVMNPYQMVKDHRTGVESGNTGSILEGEIDEFIWPYLQQRKRFTGVA